MRERRSPIFFLGGDIGTLAINRTINDLAILRAHPLGADACHIGSAGALQEDHMPTGLVTMRSQIGVSRVADMLNGEQLPRICYMTLLGRRLS